MTAIAAPKSVVRTTRRRVAGCSMAHFVSAGLAVAALIVPGAAQAANGASAAPPPNTSFGLFTDDDERVWTGMATPVSETIVRLTAGAEVTFETTEVSAGSDPVLHLLFVSGDDEEVAYDDNSGPGLAARLTHVPSATGYYLLVLRATSNDTAGIANIVRDGATSLGGGPSEAGT